MAKLVLFTEATGRIYGDPDDKTLDELYQILYPEQYLQENGHRYIDLKYTTLGAVKSNQAFCGAPNVNYTKINCFIYLLVAATKHATKQKAWLRICYDKAKSFGYSTTDIGTAFRRIHEQKLLFLRRDESGDLYFKWKYQSLLKCYLDENGFFESVVDDKKIKFLDREYMSNKDPYGLINRRLLKRCFGGLFEITS